MVDFKSLVDECFGLVLCDDCMRNIINITSKGLIWIKGRKESFEYVF